MKSKIFIFLFFFFCNKFLFADSLTLVKKIDATVFFFTTDHLGNCYLVTESGLHKYDQNGILLASFSQKNFGAIQFVDATDPMKILIFNKDFFNVIILDNKLSISTTFSLHDLDLQQPVLICTSRHDGYWIFDKQTNQLKKFNSTLQKLFESSDLSQLINAELNPVFLTESEKWIWMNNLSSGVLVFDSYGTYLKTIDKNEIDSTMYFQADDDKIILSEDNMIKQIDSVKFIKKDYTYQSLRDVQQMRIEQNRLYVMKKDIFEIYSF